MTNVKKGDFVIPVEGSEQYVYTGIDMKLGYVESVVDGSTVDAEPGKPYALIVPVAHDFRDPRIMVAVMLGGAMPPNRFTSHVSDPEHYRIATEEEVAMYQDEVDAYFAHPYSKLKEGTIIEFTESRESRRDKLHLNDVRFDKQYTVFLEEDNGMTPAIIDDAGDENNAALTHFEFKIVSHKEEN